LRLFPVHVLGPREAKTVPLSEGVRGGNIVPLSEGAGGGVNLPKKVYCFYLILE